MNNGKIFKTKTGFCHILPDKIVLTRDGIIGNLSDLTVGNSIARILIIYGFLSIGLFYLAFDNYKNGQMITSVLFCLLGIYLIYGTLNSLNNSSTPIIERQKIKNVKLKKTIAGLTRSRFEIFFEDNEGRIKKRLIMLPGSLTDGKMETEKAVKIMTDEKLLINL
ncbi:MAG: phosphoribosylaminoimidazolesuccinocarboxamide synthase [Weeksellaceae bacterium]|nr:phosphoribosylaminoimidazolesuccinocarboxamide synthase [Weeksellaceae bacterium]